MLMVSLLHKKEDIISWPVSLLKIFKNGNLKLLVFVIFSSQVNVLYNLKDIQLIHSSSGFVDNISSHSSIIKSAF